MQTRQSSISQAGTKKATNNPKYVAYINWLKQNKVLIDSRLSFPTVFEKDLVGISAKERIQPKRVIVAVPYNLIINSDKVKQMAIYHNIIKQNSVLINGEQGQIFLLCIHLIVERLKGDKGFYHPYFEIVPTTDMVKWNKKEIGQIEHPLLCAQMNKRKEQIEEAFMILLRIVRTNPDLFPQNIKNDQYRTYFEWAFQFVRTRAFSTSSNTISLIPFADAFNHGAPSLSISHSLINTDWWRQKSDYSYKRKKMNLAIFNTEELNPTAEQFKIFKQKQISERQKYIKKHQNILQQNKDKLNEEKAVERITFLQYNTGIHTIRQLQMFEQDCVADDDSNEIDENEYRKYLLKQKETIKGTKPVNYEALAKQYWNLFQQKVAKNRKKFVDENEEEEQNQLEMSSGSKQSEISQDESSESSDDDYQWIQKSNKQNIFFVVYTEEAVQKGHQVYNSYGKRSNNFLLLHYNFAIIQNQFDYYAFRLKIDGKKRKPEDLVIYQFQKKQKGAIITKQIRIVNNQICIQLINHCRYIISISTNGAQPKSIIIPNSRQQELKVLQLTKSIVKYLKQQYQTDIEQDEQLLENKTLGARLFTAIVIRKSHKQILQKQMKLLNKALQYLGRFKKNKIELKQMEMENVMQLKPYLENLERSRI